MHLNASNIFFKVCGKPLVPSDGRKMKGGPNMPPSSHPSHPPHTHTPVAGEGPSYSHTYPWLLRLNKKIYLNSGNPTDRP